MKLEKKVQRQKKQQELELEEAEHHQKLKNMKETASRTAKQEKLSMELEHKKAVNKEEASQMKRLREMGVDLTQYLISKNEKPKNLIKFAGSPSSTNNESSSRDQVKLHLHEKA